MKRLRAIDLDPDVKRSLRVIEQLCVYLQTHQCKEYVSPKGYSLLKIIRCPHCDPGVHAEELAG